MKDTRKLYDLLTRLGAGPGCYPREDSVETYWVEVDYYDEHDCDHAQYELRDNSALAILRDAARRVCDEHNVDINAPEGNFGWHGVNGWEDSESGYDDYESALIAGLEWIAEQREAK